MKNTGEVQTLEIYHVQWYTKNRFFVQWQMFWHLRSTVTPYARVDEEKTLVVKYRHFSSTVTPCARTHQERTSRNDKIFDTCQEWDVLAVTYTAINQELLKHVYQWYTKPHYCLTARGKALNSTTTPTPKAKMSVWQCGCNKVDSCSTVLLSILLYDDIVEGVYPRGTPVDDTVCWLLSGTCRSRRWRPRVASNSAGRCLRYRSVACCHAADESLLRSSTLWHVKLTASRNELRNRDIFC